MIQLQLLLVVFVAFAKGQLSTLSSEQLKLIQEQTAKIEAESKSLHSELQTIHMQIDEGETQYESRIDTIKNDTASSLKNLEYLAFTANKLEKEMERKKVALAYFMDLNAKIEFALKRAEEDVQLLRTRRENGVEAQCLKFNENFIIANEEVNSTISIPLDSRAINPHDEISPRSLQVNIPDMKVMAAKEYAAKAQLLFAIEERERLRKAVEDATLSLHQNDATLREDIEKRIKTLEHTEDENKLLEDVIVGYQNMIVDLDRAITEEVAREKDLLTDWHIIQHLISHDFQDGYNCYQRHPQNTEALLQDSEDYKREYNPQSE